MAVKRKKYGWSLRLGRIRDGFLELNESVKKACQGGNQDEFGRIMRESAAYARKYRRDLRLSAETVEDLETRVLEREKLVAEEAHKEQQLIRIRREIEELKREAEEQLKKADERGQLKWN